MNRTQLAFTGKNNLVGESSVNNTLDETNRINFAHNNHHSNNNFSTNITPRGTRQESAANFPTENTIGSMNRSRSPNSRMGSRSRQQQEDLVSRFKEQETKRNIAI